MNMETARLELVAATEEALAAEIESHGALATFLRCRVLPLWPPPFNDAQTQHFIREQLAGRPELVGWWMWYFVLWAEGTGDGERILIGNGGFKGKPDEQGQVEIGYSLLEEFHGKGYGSEAVAGLLKWAFGQGVHSVIAETLPELVGSVRVLEKNGFVFVGTGSEAGSLRYLKERE